MTATQAPAVADTDGTDGVVPTPPETETGEVAPPVTDPAATAIRLPEENVEVPAQDTGSDPLPVLPAVDGGETLEAELIEALTEEPVDLVA